MNKSKSEQLLPIIKAGISAIPVIGGPIVSLISDYVPSSTQRSVQTSMDYLKEKLDYLKDRIDVTTINQNEFSELFKNTYMTIVRTHQDIKLRSAAKLITNILLKKDDPEKLSFNELDHYSRCLDSLSIGALEILGHALSLVPLSELDKLYEKNIRIRFPDLQTKANNIDPFFLMSMLEELNSFHLIHLPGSPQVRTLKYSNYPVELTKTGYIFTKYILETSDNLQNT